MLAYPKPRPSPECEDYNNLPLSGFTHWDMSVCVCVSRGVHRQYTFVRYIYIYQLEASNYFTGYKYIKTMVIVLKKKKLGKYK